MIAWGGIGAIVWQPAHFGRIEQGGNTELIVEARVVSDLELNVGFEPLDLFSDRLEVSTFKKVIKTRIKTRIGQALCGSLVSRQSTGQQWLPPEWSASRHVIG